LRGELKSKEGDAVLSEDVFHSELAYNFEPLKERKWRFMTDGLAIGKSERIKVFLYVLRGKGIFKRRKNPVEISQYQGEIFSLREQRGNVRMGKDSKDDPLWGVMGLLP
jgi:hypothetical protein